MQNLPGRLGSLFGAGGGLLATELKLTALATLLGLEGADVLGAIEKGEIKSLADLPTYLAEQLEGAVQESERVIGVPLWELLIRAPAGLDGAAIDAGQASSAVKMVQRMLGFGMALPLITARLETVIKGVLGPHAPEGLLESIRRLPEEIGVNFFIGTVLERIFETAVGTPLEEAIAQQTRPARFDFRVVKALLTKHHLTAEQAHEYLANIGYRDHDIDAILTLAESFLSVGDIQQLYLLGSWDEGKVRAYLASLGYADDDAAALVELYLTKAETQGAQQVRATARTGYLESKITEGEYRHLLASVNTPQLSIDLEVESANLLLSWGRRQLSVANLKTLHQQGHVNDRQAQHQLEQMGFDAEDASAVITSWTVEKRATHPGLTVNRILSYELGGVISRQRALELLTETGVRIEDASLLAANPGHLGGVYAHELSVPTVLSAVREGVLGVEPARAHLTELNVAPAEIGLLISTAVAKQVRGPKPKAAHRTLSEPQVLEAFKLGLASSGWATQELTALGYPDADAQLLVALETVKMSGAIPAGWVTLT